MVAPRPREAMPSHPMAKATASATEVSIARQVLPLKMRAMACEISQGCLLRNNNESPGLTGKVSRYSIPKTRRRVAQAAPKLQRQAISARPTDGCANIALKPASVGERDSIPQHYLRGKAPPEGRKRVYSTTTLTSLPGTTTIRTILL